MSDERHDEFTDLLGAYALDAVDADERDTIERHLATCPRCRAEVAEHREVAAYLSQIGAPAPDGVWDRIAAELAPPAPPMRLAVLPSDGAPETADDRGAPTVAGPPEPVSLDQRRATRDGRSRALMAVLAVAACLIVVLGSVAVIESQRAGRGQSLDERASAAVQDSKLKVDLTGKGVTAKAVVGDDGRGYLIMDDVPAPADGDVYQLWGKVDDTVLSLGTFGDTHVVPFSVDPSRIGDIELFAVTQEKAPGVVSSTQDPMMAGTV